MSLKTRLFYPRNCKLISREGTCQTIFTILPLTSNNCLIIFPIYHYSAKQWFCELPSDIKKKRNSRRMGHAGIKRRNWIWCLHFLYKSVLPYRSFSTKKLTYFWLTNFLMNYIATKQKTNY